MADHRDSGGRFAKGNPGGPGNPAVREVARLRRALLDAVTEADIREVVGVLIDKAKAGHLPAVRELLDRAIGKPTDGDLAERLEELERAAEEIRQRWEGGEP